MRRRIARPERAWSPPVATRFVRWRWHAYWWLRLREPRWLRRMRRPLPILALLAAGAALGATSGMTMGEMTRSLAQFAHSLTALRLPSADAPSPGPRSQGTSLGGVARVLDGDTLDLDRQRIRLDGIDAPEIRQECERAGYRWACGADSAAALAGLLRGQQLRCSGDEHDRYGRLLARCWLSGLDVGGWLVREGLAVAYTRYSDRYTGEEAEARRGRRGLWGGRFEMPEEWRRRNPR